MAGAQLCQLINGVNFYAYSENIKPSYTNMKIKPPSRLPRDKELFRLVLSGTAVFFGLMWMFYGQSTVNLLASAQHQSIYYYFFSGVIFSLSLIGLYGFLRTILHFTEFMVT